MSDATSFVMELRDVHVAYHGDIGILNGLNLGVRLPILRQSVVLVTRCVFGKVYRILQLHRDFIVWIILGDRSINQIVKNAGMFLLLHGDDFARLVGLLYGKGSMKSHRRQDQR